MGENGSKISGQALKEYSIYLKTPLAFDGKTYAEFDLSPLEMLTQEEYSDILRECGENSGNIPGCIPEYELDFALLTAAMVTGLPLALFKKLSAKDISKIRLLILKYFLT